MDYGTGWFCWEDETFPVKGLISVEVVFLEALFGVVLCSKNLRCTTSGETVQSQQKTQKREARDGRVFFFLVLRFQNLRFLLI